MLKFYNADAVISSPPVAPVASAAPPAVVAPVAPVAPTRSYTQLEQTLPSGEKVMFVPNPAPTMADYAAGRTGHFVKQPAQAPAAAPSAAPAVTPAPPAAAPAPTAPTLDAPTMSDPLFDALAIMVKSGDPRQIQRASAILAAQANEGVVKSTAPAVDPFAFDESAFRATRGAELAKAVSEEMKQIKYDNEARPVLNAQGTAYEYIYPDVNSPEVQRYVKVQLDNEVLGKKFEIQEKKFEAQAKQLEAKSEAEFTARIERQVQNIVAKTVFDTIPQARVGTDKVDPQAYQLAKSVFDGQLETIMNRIGNRYDGSEMMRNSVFAEAKANTAALLGKYMAPQVSPGVPVVTPEPTQQAPAAAPPSIPTPLGASNVTTPYTPPPPNAPTTGTQNARVLERRTLRDIAKSQTEADIKRTMTSFNARATPITTPPRI